MLFRQILSAVLFIGVIAPAVADDECPRGYTDNKYISQEYELGVVPHGYTQLEYIESTGTQYIDTGISTVNFDKFELVAKANNGDFKVDQFIITTLTNNAPHTGYGVEYNIHNKKKWYQDSMIDIHTFKKIIGEYQSDKAWKISDSEELCPINLIDNTLSLFGGKTNERNFQGSARYIKLYTNLELSGYFVPAKRNLDNAIGMYDVVSNTFFKNAGTGAFIAGPEIEFSVIDLDNIRCVACPYNTYKPDVGNNECTQCPTGTFSPIGSTALSDCAKILHVGDAMVYMPVGRRTEHGLCTMLNGVKYCADLYEKK